MTLFLFRSEDGRYLTVNDDDALEFLHLQREHNSVKVLCHCTDKKRAEEWIKWVKGKAHQLNPSYVPKEIPETSCQIVEVEIP